MPGPIHLKRKKVKMTDFSDRMNPNERNAIKKFIDARGRKTWFLGTKYFYINDNTRMWYSGNDHPNIWVEVKDPVEGWVTVNRHDGPWQDDILAMARELGMSQQERLENAYKHRPSEDGTRFNRLGND